MNRAIELPAFEHPILERLSRAHPVVPILLWGPMAALLFGFGASAYGVQAAAAFAWLGALTWTLVEYMLHRWVFHFVPKRLTWRRRWYPVHMRHHDVQEWDRLVAPPLMAVPLFFVFLTAFRLLLGAPAMYAPFSGFIMGYLAYDYIHVFAHVARPHTHLGQGLRRRHLQHHFKHTTRWYGVSSPLWDFVFRTHVAGRDA